MRNSGRVIVMVAAAVVAIGAGLLISKMVAGLWQPVTPTVVEPQLSSLAVQGKTVFEANCASCHGKSAIGTDKGPPLVHNIYNPGHHADGAFFLAAKRGTRQHHWKFGDMPAQPQIKDEQIQAIVKYVRELQLANGIQFQPHNM